MKKKMHLANLVKKKRLAHPKRYSQSELSEVLGYKNGQFISNVERGLCLFPFKILNKVCVTLEITPGEIKKALMDDYSEHIDDFLVRLEDSTTTEATPLQSFKELPVDFYPLS
jgi:DNA-binding Xre family transcriptional regulator